MQKHAQCTEVTGALQVNDNHGRLLTDDNGVGFDAASSDKRPERKSWGLMIMAERSVVEGGASLCDPARGRGRRSLWR